MSNPVLPFQPSYSTASSTEAAVLTVELGDGYRESRPAGLNNTPRTWNAVFSVRDDATASILEEFFRGLRGCWPFAWAPPEQDAGLYTSASWGRTYDDSGLNGVKATFVEFFG